MALFHRNQVSDYATRTKPLSRRTLRVWKGAVRRQKSIRAKIRIFSVTKKYDSKMPVGSSPQLGKKSSSVCTVTAPRPYFASQCKDLFRQPAASRIDDVGHPYAG